MTAAFGTLAEQALDRASGTTATDLTEPSTDDLDLRTLPARLDDQLLERVRSIAQSPVPTFASSSREHFDKCMKVLALLPRKADDVTKGSLRLEVYWRKLGGYPEAAWTYLADRGLDRFSFFPTVKECREVLEAWPVPGEIRARKSVAGRRVEDELAARLDDLATDICKGLIDEEAINALNDRTKALLEARMVLLGSWNADAGCMEYRIRPSALVGQAA